MNLTKKYQIIFLKFNKLIPKNKLEEKTKFRAFALKKLAANTILTNVFFGNFAEKIYFCAVIVSDVSECCLPLNQ